MESCQAAPEDYKEGGIFSQFGILRDGYTARRAFEVYRLLIDEPGTG